MISFGSLPSNLNGAKCLTNNLTWRARAAHAQNG